MEKVTSGFRSAFANASGMIHHDGIAQAASASASYLSSASPVLRAHLSQAVGSVSPLMTRETAAAAYSKAKGAATGAVERLKPLCTKRNAAIVGIAATSVVVAAVAAPVVVGGALGVTAIGPTAGGAFAALQSGGIVLSAAQSMVMTGAVGLPAAVAIGTAVGGLTAAGAHRWLPSKF
eukprot:TRINITY_DN10888_c0_g1_i1.p1 TRINITY_DN10888_c0_g1~~TRINITY_DN10888_c0_g1_i1.p1  ORF type:complete len:178 (-),score=29.80 TRINITY_DN10888_c0_g1_i1:146-679(-)